MWPERRLAESSTLLHILAILLLGIVIYANSLNVPFTFDDRPNIVNNPAIKDFHSLLDAAQAKSDLPDPMLKPQMASRIVGYASFALNYRVHGLSVFGYHLINIIVHLANALLVYCLVNLLFRAEKDGPPANDPDDYEKSSRLIALFSALLFVSHPVHTQAVTYVVQRFTSLATFFYLLSVVGYVKSRLSNNKGPLFIFAIISALFAMKTKEISFTLPFVLVLIEFMFFNDRMSKRAVYLLPFAMSVLIIPLTLIATSVITGNAVNATSLEFGSSQEIPRWDYFITQLTVIVTYLKLLLPPVTQNLDYDYPLFHSFFSQQVFVSALLLGSLISVGIFFWRASRRSVWFAKYARVISFGMFWFFITISAESSIIRIKDLVFEHRLYLPSIGLFIAVIGLIAMLKNYLIMSGSALEKLIVPCTVFIVLLMSFATYARNIVWQNEIRLWQDTVSKSPKKPRVHNYLAMAYYDNGLFDEALKENKLSLTLKPDPGIHVNVGNIYLKQERFEEAMKEYEAAVALKPDFEKAYYGMCNSYYIQKLLPDAFRACGLAIKFKPDYAEAHNLMGIIYFDQGNLEEALVKFRSAISYKPNFAIAHNNAGNTYYRMKSYDLALKEYQIVSLLDPTYIGVNLNMGKIYHDLGRFGDAVNEYQKALQQKPNFPEALKLLEITKLAIIGNAKR